MAFESISFRLMGTKDYCQLFLWPPKMLLLAIFFWPMQKYYKRATMFAIIMVWLTFLLIGIFFFLSSIQNDMVLFGTNLTNAILIAQTMVKTTVLYWKNEDLKQMLDDINYKFWPYDLVETKVKSEIKTFYKIIVLFMLSELFLGFGYCIITVIPWTSFSFAFPVSYSFFNYNESPYFEIIFVMEFIALPYFTSCLIIGCDYFFVAISSCIIVQYKLLNEALLAFNTPLMFDINQKMRKLDIDNLKAKNYNIHKEYFVRCVDHHNLLLKCVKRTNSMFGFTILVQLVQSTAGICIGIITLTSVNTNVPFSMAVTAIIFIVNYINELFQICVIGNELYYQASLLPEFIFSSNWKEYANNEMTKDIMFVIQRTQDIPRLTAYNLYDANMNNFVAVIKLAFSIYTFLHKLGQK